MNKMPEMIWAWLHPESTCGSFIIVKDLADKRDTEYIRADLLAAKDARIAFLEKAMGELLYHSAVSLNTSHLDDSCTPYPGEGWVLMGDEIQTWTEVPTLAAWLKEKQ